MKQNVQLSNATPELWIANKNLSASASALYFHKQAQQTKNVAERCSVDLPVIPSLVIGHLNAKYQA